jgi:hypothetical protein
MCKAQSKTTPPAPTPEDTPKVKGELVKFLDECYEGYARDGMRARDLLVAFCKKFDALIDETLNECNGNLVVHGVTAKLQDCLQTCVLKHMSPPTCPWYLPQAGAAAIYRQPPGPT